VELGRVDSPPLKVLLPVAMQTSFNLYSQLLWLQVGDAAAASEPAADAGSTASTTAERALGALDDFLRVAGVPSSGVRLLEGTGLAEGNMLSAEAIVSLLRFMDRHRDAVLFRASLATAGRDGTLAQRMKGTPAEGNVQAKTGTLSTVHALSGYVRTARGEPLAFAIILNAAHVSREAGRQAVDEVAVVLAGFDGTSGGLAP
jgi:D-alanyl-D-alanine carboxypeptidase/D-alanyl-D-alanine-endopeptidase (penicillin-binding protein 4)